MKDEMCSLITSGDNASGQWGVASLHLCWPLSATRSQLLSINEDLFGCSLQNSELGNSDNSGNSGNSGTSSNSSTCGDCVTAGTFATSGASFLP